MRRTGPKHESDLLCISVRHSLQFAKNPVDQLRLHAADLFGENRLRHPSDRRSIEQGLQGQVDVKRRVDA